MTLLQYDTSSIPVSRFHPLKTFRNHWPLFVFPASSPPFLSCKEGRTCTHTPAKGTGRQIGRRERYGSSPGPSFSPHSSCPEARLLQTRPKRESDVLKVQPLQLRLVYTHTHTHAFRTANPDHIVT